MWWNADYDKAIHLERNARRELDFYREINAHFKGRYLEEIKAHVFNLLIQVIRHCAQSNDRLLLRPDLLQLLSVVHAFAGGSGQRAKHPPAGFAERHNAAPIQGALSRTAQKFFRASAVRLDPCLLTPASSTEVAIRVREALRCRRGFSLIRVGEGEATFLLPPEQATIEAVARRLEYYFGHCDVSLAQWTALCAALRQSVIHADVLCPPEPGQWRFRSRADDGFAPRYRQLAECLGALEFPEMPANVRGLRQLRPACRRHAF